MRPEFREIVSGWTLYDGTLDLDERLERLAVWARDVGILQPDEEATSKMMIEAQLARHLADDPDPLMRLAGELVYPRPEPDGDPS